MPELNMSASTGFGHHPGTIVLHRLRRHWKLFLVVFTITFVAIACIVFLLPVKYESQMRLLVNTERQDLVISPSDGKDGTYYQELAEIRVNSEIEVLKSRDVLQQVVLKSGLATDPATGAASPRQSSLYVDRAVRSLERHLEIAPVKKSEIISVSYRAKNPVLANTVLKNLAEAYLGQHLRAHEAPGSFTFFDEQANAYASRLAQSEDQLRTFREQHAALLNPDEKDPLTQRAIDAQAALDDSEAQVSEYKKRVEAGLVALARMDQRVTSQISTSPQTALISQLSGMLAELQNRRTELITKFRSDDRLVTEIDKEIADTRAALNSVTAHSNVEQVSGLNQVRQDTEKDLTVSKVTLAGTEARQARLTALVKGYKDQMYQLAGAETENDQLARAVKENEENYLLYSKKREEARIAESLDQKRITDVSLIEAPTLQGDPVSPVVPLDLAIGFLLAAMVAYLCVRVRDNFSSPWPVEHRVDSTRSFAA
jgi:succinoglycan biosynthesis transport protein ExoP